MTHHSDTDAFDDLRHIAGLALSRAGKTGPVREGLQLRIDRLEAWLTESNKQHGELLTALEESVAAEAAPPQTILTCVYCGQEYPAGTPAAGSDVAVLTAHIATCGRHPMRALEAEVAKLTLERDEWHAAARRWEKLHGGPPEEVARTIELADGDDQGLAR